jgi:hypothetical protein
MEFEIPSGKLTFCYEKSPSLIGKSTINVPFSMAMLNYQRVNLMGLPISRQPSWVTAASRFFLHRGGIARPAGRCCKIRPRTLDKIRPRTLDTLW